MTIRPLLAIAVLVWLPTTALAQAPVPPVAHPCPRPAAGSVIANPPSLFSHEGVLRVAFSYQTRKDSDGRTLFCFMTPSGLENPTLQVRPGDHLIVTVTNHVPASSGMSMALSGPVCGASTMTASSLNIHYHGTNTSPTCHQDEVIHTIINSGETFQYDVSFPADEPPGLYWYHPHIHGIAEPAVQGGASGAIIVQGLQNIQPAVTGLRQRVLMIRDQNVAGNPAPGGAVPSWDLSVNFVPIAYPALTPAVLRMNAGERQLWRVSNSTADSILDLQLQFDGAPQMLEVVGIDGVPTGSQDGTRQGKIVQVNHLLIPTAGRVEFIVSAPPATVRAARLVTMAIDTGPIGDNDTQRTLATIQTVAPGASIDDPNVVGVASTAAPAGAQRFEGLADVTPSVRRHLYFSEVLSDPTNPLSPTNFFITVDGATPTLFSPDNPPAIVTKQGSVEEWVIENRAQENHEFHMHQIHFLVLSQDNFQINGSVPLDEFNGQLADMIQIPYWDGNPGHGFPRVKVLMDFRGPDIGDFVYHCHILGHEDNGMMAIIRVLPGDSAKASTPASPAAERNHGSKVSAPPATHQGTHATGDSGKGRSETGDSAKGRSERPNLHP
jgi:FtsP/CotA-like multicopper oxidase with cupredoxin domain